MVINYTGVGKCPILGILDITWKSSHLVDQKYLMVGWCEKWGHLMTHVLQVPVSTPVIHGNLVIFPHFTSYKLLVMPMGLSSPMEMGLFHTMWGPPVMERWFINPMNTIVIGTINHSENGVISRLSYRSGAPLCMWFYWLTTGTSRPWAAVGMKLFEDYMSWISTGHSLDNLGWTNILCWIRYCGFMDISWVQNLISMY